MRSSSSVKQSRPLSQLFENIVHLREREAGMLRLPCLTMSVQFFRYGARNSRAFQPIIAIRAREWIKTNEI